MEQSINRLAVKTLRVLVIGNMGSGKSTVATLVSKRLGLRFFALDEFRTEHSDGSLAGEFLAKAEWFRQIQNHEECVLEFTGLGAGALLLKELLIASGVLIVKLSCPVEECLRRVQARSKENIEFFRLSDGLERDGDPVALTMRQSVAWLDQQYARKPDFWWPPVAKSGSGYLELNSAELSPSQLADEICACLTTDIERPSTG